MLANGADNSAVHSFQTLRTFFSKLSKRLVIIFPSEMLTDDTR